MTDRWRLPPGYGLICRSRWLDAARSCTAISGDLMAIWHRLKKKILKRYVLYAFFPATRPTALRWCGWEIGEEVYIADGLMIVEELADHHNLRCLLYTS